MTIKSFGDTAPQIASSAFVSEMAYVIGDVEVGEGASIWPGVVLRGDVGKIVIGKNTNIQDNSVVHADPGHHCVIGDDVTVGHGAVIHSYRIGSNVLIGMNSTISSQVEIGDFCIIGSNSMVGDRKKIPSYSFVVGVPAEVKGSLSQDQITRLQKIGQSYARLAQRHKELGL
ncbi:MAG: gamma carbonic anhydrase family protein [Chloroflexi bacterium]|nr:gamma carbonic anhydrase family protein [Chloroflexota bacterium]